MLRRTTDERRRYPRKTEDELKALLLDLRKNQFNARFQKTQGTLENTSEIRKTRRTIARVKTILTEKKSGTPEARRAPKKSGG
jgi:large subunit ribosomal protein L29